MEFFPIKSTEPWARGNHKVFSCGGAEDTHPYLSGLKAELETGHGVYIFYYSRSRALYASQARLQSLWREINLAFNRDRDVQNIGRVDHPVRRQRFRTPDEIMRKVSSTNVRLHELAVCVSAYGVADGMICDLEALLIRAFPNDLLNSRMETFGKSAQSPPHHVPIGPCMALAPAPVTSQSTTALRWLYRRTKPPSGRDRLVLHALNMWWIAHAASEETIQGGMMSPHFMSLFDGHLSCDDRTWLRWRDELVASAEMRRAYSALYGRFFARGMFQRLLGLTDFVPLHTQQTVVGAATVTRACKGDIPDWIAWDPTAATYVLVEAKGSLTGKVSEFLSGVPDCVSNGKAQFDRVAVKDAAGTTLAVDGWVGANRWATDVRGGAPVFFAYDPPGDGRRLRQDESPNHARRIHRSWLASLAVGFAEPGLGDRSPDADARVSTTIGVWAPPSDSMKPPKAPKIRFGRGAEAEEEADAPSARGHAGRYIPAALTVRGLQVYKGASARDELLGAQKLAFASGEPAWFVGLHLAATQAGFMRRSTWSAGHGLVGQGGLGVFDLRAVTFGRLISRP